MSPKLYGMESVPAVRSVLLTAEAIGVDLDFKFTDIMTGQHMTPEFLKINPQHTLPTLDDNGFILWDSHAICMYLNDIYAPDDRYYPKDSKKRAVVNQRLFFEACTLSPVLEAIARPIFHDGVKEVRQDLGDKAIKAYNILESFLEHHTYVADNEITIADFCTIANITSLNIFVPILEESFPNITKWMTIMQFLPYYHINQSGLDNFESRIRCLMQK